MTRRVGRRGAHRRREPKIGPKSPLSSGLYTDVAANRKRACQPMREANAAAS